MSRAKFLHRCATGVCAAAIAVSPVGVAGGLAQPAAAPAPAEGDDVTTVAPLTIRPQAPDVGKGITFQDLAQVETQAHDEARAADDCVDHRQYLVSSGIFGPNPVQQLENGYWTADRDAWLALEAAAKAATAGAQAAADARAKAGPDADASDTVAAAELASQNAVKTYLADRAAASEAERRVADTQRQIDDWITRGFSFGSLGDGQALAPDIKAAVEAQAKMRTQPAGARGLYVPDEYKDLGLTDVVSAERHDKGVTVLHISGKILNPRKTSIPIPPLWFAAVDEYGLTLKAEQAQSPLLLGRIPAGRSLAFTFDLSPMPVKTQRVAVSFAPQSRAPLVGRCGIGAGQAITGVHFGGPANQANIGDGDHFSGPPNLRADWNGPPQ